MRAGALGALAFMLAALGACEASVDSTDADGPTGEATDAGIVLCYAPAVPTQLVGVRWEGLCVPIECNNDVSIRFCEASAGACVVHDCVAIACSGTPCASSAQP